MRNDVYQAIRTKLSPLTADYFGLIFLGNKQQESAHTLRTMFSYWGLSHYLARSGLHIILFIMLWSFFFRIIPLHGSIKRVMLVVICVVYDFLSWSSIPFARAYYAFLLMKGGELLYQQINYLHILSIVCLSILLFNPMQLFFLDFQLTFALTFTLVFLSALFSAHKKPIVSKKGPIPFPTIMRGQ
jgi:competence protein ComEC